VPATRSALPRAPADPRNSNQAHSSTSSKTEQRASARVRPKGPAPSEDPDICTELNYSPLVPPSPQDGIKTTSPPPGITGGQSAGPCPSQGVKHPAEHQNSSSLRGTFHGIIHRPPTALPEDSTPKIEYDYSPSSLLEDSVDCPLLFTRGAVPGRPGGR
jgi:hypothetical protein